MILDNQKKYFCLEITLYVVLFYAISACVFLNGDDFMYGSFSKNGIFENVFSYYITGNGRFWINILDSLLLYFDRYLFIVINPLIIMAFIILLAKNVQWINEKKADILNERKYIRYGMVLFACLDVLCLREIAFWITGMMNYLFPATLFLFALLLFQMHHTNNEYSLLKKTLFCIVCFFAGSSVEQYALMFVGVMTLVIATDIYYKNKTINNKTLWIGYLFSLIGLAILLLAPGNFVRVDAQSEWMPPLIDNLWTLIYQNTMSPVAFPLLLMLLICGRILISENKSSKLICNISNVVILIALLIRCFPIFEKAIIVAGLLVLISIEYIYILVINNYYGKKDIISLAFVGVGSQIMLLISVIWGFRCMFSMYVIYMLLIIFFLSKFDDEKRGLTLCCGIISSISPVFLAILLVLKAILKNKKYNINVICRTMTCFSVVLSLISLLQGYAYNIPTHISNVENSAIISNNEQIHLYELPNDTYSWYFIPMGEFHENYYKMYHNIPASIVVDYVENEEEK